MTCTCGHPSEDHNEKGCQRCNCAQKLDRQAAEAFLVQLKAAGLYKES